MIKLSMIDFFKFITNYSIDSKIYHQLKKSIIDQLFI
jgi:hypothetical protein